MIVLLPEGVDPLPTLDRGEQVRVPMKGRTVQEFFGQWGWQEWCGSPTGWNELHPSERRERLVAPIQPAGPCPDCDGTGEHVTTHYSYDGDPPERDVEACWGTCGGSGWVGGDLGLVTRQALCEDGSWFDAPDDVWHASFDNERRLVMAHRTQVIEALPVVDADVVDQVDGPCIDVNPTDGTVWLWGTGMEPRVVTDESWAQHLTPGMFVATLVGLWPIDPPVVPTKTCEFCRGVPKQHPFERCTGCQGHLTVPLSVTPGEAVGTVKLFFDTEFIEDGRTIELVSIGIVREDGQTYYAESGEADLARADEWVRENVLVHLRGPIKTRREIAAEVVAFAGESPEFWAYYADYDWVVLCQLYGRMIDLPSGWPMYCRDLKQLVDEFRVDTREVPKGLVEHDALADAQWNLKLYKYVRASVTPGEAVELP